MSPHNTSLVLDIPPHLTTCPIEALRVILEHGFRIAVVQVHEVLVIPCQLSYGYVL
jgi:hypothetical protein